MKTPAPNLTAPSHLCTTFQRLHDADACVEGYGKLAGYIRDHESPTSSRNRETVVEIPTDFSGCVPTLSTTKWSAIN